MAQQKPRRKSVWQLPGFARIAAAWHTLTEPPASITDARQRQQSRLIAILCLSGVLTGIIAVTISDYWHNPDVGFLQNPSLVVSVICDVLVLVTYFLGRNARTIDAAATMLVITIVAGTFVSMISDPSDYDTLVMYLVVGQVFAGLLLSPMGTRMTMLLTFAGLALIPFFSRDITFAIMLRSLGAIFVVSVVTAIGVTVRRKDLRTIEQQARQLERARQQAESANQLKGVFLGMVSHELRTPLNNILGYSDQMLMGLTGNLPGEAIEAAERIHRNGQNLGRMISDLLVLSRLESGSLTIARRLFPLTDLLTDLNHSFRERAQAKGLAFIVTVDEALPPLLVGDPQRIEQIVGNLVSNAVKFTDRGSITLRVRKCSPDEWSAEVSDTGIGLSDEDALHVFDRFFQVDSTSRRSYSGAGLGLAIARELAILMGGSITLRTAAGEGSTFIMTLPLTTDEADKPPAKASRIATLP